MQEDNHQSVLDFLLQSHGPGTVHAPPVRSRNSRYLGLDDLSAAMTAAPGPPLGNLGMRSRTGIRNAPAPTSIPSGGQIPASAGPSVASASFATPPRLRPVAALGAGVGAARARGASVESSDDGEIEFDDEYGLV